MICMGVLLSKVMMSAVPARILAKSSCFGLVRRVHSITSKFCGVCWSKKSKKYQAQVCVEGLRCHVGVFSDEEEAAHAYDAKLRALCADPVRLKKSLNFPTNQEASYEESLLQTRSRGLRASSRNFTKELESFHCLQDRFLRSAEALGFEIVHVPSLSRVDALFQPQGSVNGGLCLQLKSSSCLKDCGSDYYHFSNVSGYDGQLLVFVALDRDIIWLLPGSEVSQQHMRIRLGSQRDKEFRVDQLGPALTKCFQNDNSFPHATLQDALMRCSRNHMVEERSHAQLVAAFAAAGLQLTRPPETAHTVDSVLDWDGQRWRVQEKAARPKTNGQYLVNLTKNGGCLGSLAYASADFDLLIGSILEHDCRLAGIFIFPSSELALRGILGQKPRVLLLYPPWALPKHPAVARKHAWQLDHFVDLRSWKGSDLDPATKARLVGLLSELPKACEVQSGFFTPTPPIGGLDSGEKSLNLFPKSPM